MLLSIGILAHNEEANIGRLIEDLGKQRLLANDEIRIEIHVVANGCSDDTARVSREALAAPSFQRINIASRVHDIAQSGKSNAWNEFIHVLASPQTDFAFLLDADIRIPEATTLERVFEALRRSETACVAVDESVKDLSVAPNKSLIERLILAASGTANDTRTAIAGALYCARFDVLRDIWMPIGLPGEDGFLRAMILTSSFSRDEDLRRIVFAEGARHIFESERSIRGVFRHNIRLAIGTAINVLLFQHIREKVREGANVADYIRQRNGEDPHWINELIAQEIRRGRYFLLNRSFLFKRLERLQSFPLPQRLQRGPIYLIGFLFDAALFLAANRLMRKGAGAGFW